jgi:hypothetical protein
MYGMQSLRNIVLHVPSTTEEKRGTVLVDIRVLSTCATCVHTHVHVCTHVHYYVYMYILLFLNINVNVERSKE